MKYLCPMTRKIRNCGTTDTLRVKAITTYVINEYMHGREVSNVKNLAENMDYPYAIVSALVRRGLVHLTERRLENGHEFIMAAPSDQERLAGVRRGISEGLSADEIKVRTGLSDSGLRYLVERENIRINLGSQSYKTAAMKTRIQRGDGHFIPVLLNAFDLTPASFSSMYEEVADQVGKSQPTRFMGNPRSQDTIFMKRLDNMLKTRGRVKIDRLVKRGLPGGAIAKKMGVSRQMIEQYIIGSGQFNRWMESRRGYETSNAGQSWIARNIA